MSISEFNDFSMSNWSKIQWFFHHFLIFTNFKNFSWNSMIFPWSWNRSEFQWFFKSCGNPVLISTRALSKTHLYQIPLRDGVFHKYQGLSADGSTQWVTHATHLNRSHDSIDCCGNQKPRLKAKCQYLLNMTRITSDSSKCSELQVYELSNQSRLATLEHWVGWKTM